MSFVVRWVHSGLLDEARRVAGRCAEAAKASATDSTRCSANFANGIVTDLEQVDLAPFDSVESFLAQADRYVRSRPAEASCDDPTRIRDELLAFVSQTRAATVR